MADQSTTIVIPASKSHTIRALIIAAFADGTSYLRRPLVSKDTLSCRRAIGVLGAGVKHSGDDWIVHGLGSVPCLTAGTIDVGNSGTTLYMCSAMAALGGKSIRFDGDDQIRRRPAGDLLNALRDLGASVEGDSACAPYSIRGPLRPGRTAMDCPVSQYLSALLLASPLIRPDRPDRGGIFARKGGPKYETRVEIGILNEKPYVEMTLDWLDRQEIVYKRRGWEEISIPAGQNYKAFDSPIPADWSSASFFLVAAAISGRSLYLEGLDSSDSQGDKAVVSMLEAMGCSSTAAESGLYIHGGPLKGAVHDLNATPDALPAMAVACCFARGESRLVNVPQARLKETDRIACMSRELGKLGARIEELDDGMIIHGGGRLQGGVVEGHGDHRIVMALAVAGLGCEGVLKVTDTEAVDITFPGFFEQLSFLSAGKPGQVT